LIGPGGSGKSTVAPLLAAHLGTSSADLDVRFTAAHGCVDAFLAMHGYLAYAAANVAAYFELAANDEPVGPIGVAALSSGFMTYPPDVHPRYAALRDAIAVAPTTIVLLPALELEACVAETVRRQVSREVGRMSAERAEAKIRDRFARYVALPAPKVVTAGPPDAVAAVIAALLQR
jgi:shikimate kinase